MFYQYFSVFIGDGNIFGVVGVFVKSAYFLSLNMWLGISSSQPMNRWWPTNTNVWETCILVFLLCLHVPALLGACCF